MYLIYLIYYLSNLFSILSIYHLSSYSVNTSWWHLLNANYLQSLVLLTLPYLVLSDYCKWRYSSFRLILPRLSLPNARWTEWKKQYSAADWEKGWDLETRLAAPCLATCPLPEHPSSSPLSCKPFVHAQSSESSFRFLDCIQLPCNHSSLASNPSSLACDLACFSLRGVSRTGD